MANNLCDLVLILGAPGVAMPSPTKTVNNRHESGHDFPQNQGFCKENKYCD